MPPVFHSYDELIGIPAEILELVQELDRPLPDTLKSVLREHTTLSPVAKKQLQQVPLETCCSFRNDVASKRLLDVLDTTLLTSAGIQEQMCIWDEYGTKPTNTQWYTLFRTLSRVCCANSRVLADISFAQPRDFDREEGTASMLFGFAAGPSMFPSSGDLLSSNLSDSKTESSNGRDSKSNSASADDEESELSESDKYSMIDRVSVYRILDDAEVIFGLHNGGSERRVLKEEFIDLPMDAHMLAGKEQLSFVMFPVICIADKHNILPLIASAACHRYSWGQHTPTIGFQISKHGHSVQTYFAWTDASPCVQAVPTVHVLEPVTGLVSELEKMHARQGIFDLTDPHSILQLALFILSLGPHFLSLQQGLPQKFPGRLSWRADTYVDALESKVTRWLQSIDKDIPDEPSMNSDRSSTSVAPPPLFPSTLGMSTKSKLLDVKSPASAIQSGQPLAQMCAPNETATNCVTQNSCSTFSGKALSDDGGTITSWLTQRRVFALARVQQVEGAPLKLKPEGFDAMIDLYNDLTSLQLIEEWNGTDWRNFTPVDKCFNNHHDALFKAYADIVKAQNESPSFIVKNMHAGHANIIKSRLSLLFKAVDGGFTKEAQTIRPNEAECRHDWDALLENFYVSQLTEVTSDAVLLERMLKLSKNSLYEDFRSTGSVDVIDELVEDLWEHTLHLNGVLVYYRKHPPKQGRETIDNEAFNQQCIQAKDVVNAQHSKYALLQGQSEALRAEIDETYAEEPSTGTCDAVLFTRTKLRIDRAEAKTAETTYANFRFILAEPNSPRPGLPGGTQWVATSGTRSQGTARDNPGGSPKVKPSAPPPDDDISRAHDLLSTVLYTPESLLIAPASKLDSSTTRVVAEGASPKCTYDLPILLPQLLVEYKTPNKTESKAWNQGRMNCVSAVAFLAAIGITDYPVFGLVTSGTIGAVIMAWRDKQGKTFIIERNAQKYDISHPLEVFQFASFLIRLRARDQAMEEILAPLRENLLQERGVLDWAMPL